jgi:anti-sigma regulatory factor (Ser/Thr protein kinase)
MKRITLSMRNNAKDLTALIRQAGLFLESGDLSPVLVYKANLVLEEVLTNIVKYAYTDTSAHEIGVLLEIDDKDLIMRFVDDGAAFDPLSLPPPAVKESLSGSTEGGLGVYLVRKSVSSIVYRRTQAGNVLTTKISLNAV